MVINSQMSCENNNKKWKANSEPRTLPANGIAIHFFSPKIQKISISDII